MNLNFKRIKTQLADYRVLIMIGLITAFTVLLFHHLAVVPGEFIDEINYMNEVISKASFGTDIHGLKAPVYLSSVWGQGQSALYSWLSVPLVKVFGFSVWLFRMPMAFLTILAITLIVIGMIYWTKQKLLAVFICLALVTTPWFFISGRWVLDANVAPIFIILGLLALIGALMTNQYRIKYSWLVLSAILIGISLYGYIATWLYVPVLLATLAIYIWWERLLSASQFVTFTLVILVISLPIIAFAYQVNVVHITQPQKFLWFDLPPLPGNRVGSLISFQGDVAKTIIKNILAGLNMFLSGSDNLPWNSAKPFGAILPWMLVFLPIGLLPANGKLSEPAERIRTIIIISLFTSLPAMAVITPNYNHWNFVMFPLVLLIGFGMYLVAKSLTGVLAPILMFSMPLALFSWFLILGYFGTNTRTTFFTSQQVQISQVREINHLMETKYRHDRLYVNNLSGSFMAFRLVQKPIDAKTYLMKQGAGSSSDKKFIIAPSQQYGYLRDQSDLVKKAKTGDLTLLPNGSPMPSVGTWDVRKVLEYDGTLYKLIQRR